MPLFQNEKIEIPPALQYYLIGKGWQLIQSILHDWGGTLINFSALGIIKLQGPTDDVAEAKKQLLDLPRLPGSIHEVSWLSWTHGRRSSLVLSEFTVSN